MESNKVASATKWSFITEITAKLVSPITNAILARILVPEAFGMVATINMVVSFTNIFTDAGFQKYIIQHEFSNKEEKNETVNVAFWSNLILSLILFLVLVIFRNPIAKAVGTPELGWGIAVAGLSLPITAFSSIQMSVFKREMDFKTLFYVRIVGVIVPLIVTVPLAFVTKSYWALVIGTISGNLVNAIILTIASPWKPYLKYSVAKFREMFSFCYWILIESILVWVTSYIGTFIVGRFISSYYLGIYKTSMTTVEQFTSLITTATSGVLFSAMSRLQDKREEMYELYLNFMRLIAMLLIPMGIGMYLYSDCVTMVLLGNQWGEAAAFIGLWGLCNSFGIVLSSYWDGMFNAVGKPKYSVITQAIYLSFLIPLLLYGASRGYNVLYHMRCLSKIIYIFVEITAVWIVFKIKPFRAVKTIIPAVLCSIPMIVAACIMRQFSTNTFAELVQICICVVVYFATACIIPSTRKDIVNILVMSKIPVPAGIKKLLKVE